MDCYDPNMSLRVLCLLDLVNIDHKDSKDLSGRKNITVVMTVIWSDIKASICKYVKKPTCKTETVSETSRIFIEDIFQSRNLTSLSKRTRFNKLFIIDMRYIFAIDIDSYDNNIVTAISLEHKARYIYGRLLQIVTYFNKKCHFLCLLSRFRWNKNKIT